MEKTTILFTRMDAAALYWAELSGQISDGIYENSRPHNHWLWLRNCDSVISPDGTEGFYGPTWFVPDSMYLGATGCSRLKKYTLGSLISRIRKSDKAEKEGNPTGWQWTRRLIGISRFGSCLSNDDIDALKSEASCISIVMEFVMDYMFDNSDRQVTYDEVMKNCINAHVCTKEDFNKSTLLQKYMPEFLAKGKYYDYYVNELNDAHNHMLKSVNTFLGYSYNK